MPTPVTQSSRGSVLRFVREDADDAPAIRIAPLVDIVLLLICFYLVVSRSIQTHDDPLVQLPYMAEQRTMVAQSAEVVINLREDGSVMVNARPTRLAELPELLRHERERAGGQKLDVVIRADGRQQYERLDELLDACRRAGLGQVVLRSTQERAP